MKSTLTCFMSYSGGGKDTQAALLRKYIEKQCGNGSVVWLSTGDEMRAMVEDGGHIGKMVSEKVMKAGDIAPPFLATLLWAQKVRDEFTPGKHIIFPSSPRTLQEAQDMSDMVDFLDIDHLFPVFINVKREEAFRRLRNRDRSDDTPEIINNRLDYFIPNVMPAVKHFGQTLIEIKDDGSLKPEELSGKILDNIAHKMFTRSVASELAE